MYYQTFVEPNFIMSRIFDLIEHYNLIIGRFNGFADFTFYDLLIKSAINSVHPLEMLSMLNDGSSDYTLYKYDTRTQSYTPFSDCITLEVNELYILARHYLATLPSDKLINLISGSNLSCPDEVKSESSMDTLQPETPPLEVVKEVVVPKGDKPPSLPKEKVVQKSVQQVKKVIDSTLEWSQLDWESAPASSQALDRELSKRLRLAGSDSAKLRRVRQWHDTACRLAQKPSFFSPTFSHGST
jgi:hypothetical protein